MFDKSLHLSIQDIKLFVKCDFHEVLTYIQFPDLLVGGEGYGGQIMTFNGLQYSTIYCLKSYSF